MKVDVRIVILMLGAVMFWKVPGPRAHTAVFLLLIQVVLVVFKFLAVIGVASVILIGTIAAWGKWQNWREGREAKKNSRVGGGLGYAR